MTVTGLTPGAKYYFGVRAVNAEPSMGGLSNSPSALARKPSVGVGTWDDTDSAWVYSGSWNVYSLSSAYAGTFHYSNKIGNSASINIDSQRFSLVYTAYSTGGMYDVLVDGVSVNPFDLLQQPDCRIDEGALNKRLLVEN